jgi:hypothetical protein
VYESELYAIPHTYSELYTRAQQQQNMLFFHQHFSSFLPLSSPPFPSHFNVFIKSTAATEGKCKSENEVKEKVIRVEGE